MADLFHRVSIRKYQEKKVEPEKLDYILRASMAAPSACNQQPWEFYIVEDPEILGELSETTPYAKLTAKAPVAIVTAYRKECTVPAYAQIDLSICMENMWLATDEVGLGGVWMGIAPLEDRMEKVEKIIGIPETSLELLVSDEELAKRKANWQPREPKVTTGYLARYAAMVTSGNRGAILEVPKK